MHLVLRKCDLLLNSLTSNSHGENMTGAVAIATVFSSGEILLVVLVKPLHLEEIWIIDPGWSIYYVKQTELSLLGGVNRPFQEWKKPQTTSSASLNLSLSKCLRCINTSSGPRPWRSMLFEEYLTTTSVIYWFMVISVCQCLPNTLVPSNNYCLDCQKIWHGSAIIYTHDWRPCKILYSAIIKLR